VTKRVLLPLGFQTVDLFDLNPKFIEIARSDLPPSRLGMLTVSGLHGFRFDTKTKYNLIWVEGVLQYVHDDTMVSFLNRASKALINERNAYIVVKEAIWNDGNNGDDAVYIKEELIVLRSERRMIGLFERAGLQVAYVVWCRIFILFFHHATNTYFILFNTLISNLKLRGMSIVAVVIFTVAQNCVKLPPCRTARNGHSICLFRFRALHWYLIRVQNVVLIFRYSGRTISPEVGSFLFTLYRLYHHHTPCHVIIIIWLQRMTFKY
jgi:hypothetical protein